MHSMPSSLLKERSQGQSSGVVEEESQMIGTQGLRTKKTSMR